MVSQQRASAWIPATDIATTTTHLIVTMDLAGVAEEDINITYTRPTLTITGQRRPIEGQNCELTYHTRERAWSRFRRDITLPEEIDLKNAAIALNQGILTITARRHRSPHST